MYGQFSKLDSSRLSVEAVKRIARIGYRADARRQVDGGTIEILYLEVETVVTLSTVVHVWHSYSRIPASSFRCFASSFFVWLSVFAPLTDSSSFCPTPFGEIVEFHLPGRNKDSSSFIVSYVRFFLTVFDIKTKLNNFIIE